ncbi:uncharacterized protein LOC102805386 [Saccoglossus kowalevskii]|uniref:Uncharacterized protein LOC102805386 n=1 Tax=Saccoglossus kowalevskii TaxID=10224 RepID=A0ABM0MB46_SACKO|nr:PREDICTED: uncharacterized protein LOC102805386 [Saccoglossus kowalevskii]
MQQTVDEEDQEVEAQTTPKVTLRSIQTEEKLHSYYLRQTPERNMQADKRSKHKPLKENVTGSQLSLCELAIETSFKSVLPASPVHLRHLAVPHRHSPRFKAASLSPYASNKRTTKNIFNIPSTRKLVSSHARTQYSFKSFHTPTPLRKSQMEKQTSASCLSSPEVELEPVNLCAVYITNSD